MPIWLLITAARSTVESQVSGFMVAAKVVLVAYGRDAT